MIYISCSERQYFVKYTPRRDNYESNYVIYRAFSSDVVAAMLEGKNNTFSLLWEIWSIFMQNCFIVSDLQHGHRENPLLAGVTFNWTIRHGPLDTELYNIILYVRTLTHNNLVLLNIFVYYMYVTVLHYGKIKIDWLIDILSIYTCLKQNEEKTTIALH